ncbi:Uncharacterized protein dnm_027920 [Desulfonema magnum]|uniref:Uncharacterized protein n=1 Tax=Desulfonema magnum TaxID=45655 RepID=A0A975BK08_9BACT|nr:Uncharacterized protein dnm_027920 [Desulfonema magnum]
MKPNTFNYTPRNQMDKFLNKIFIIANKGKSQWGKESIQR